MPLELYGVVPGSVSGSGSGGSDYGTDAVPEDPWSEDAEYVV